MEFSNYDVFAYQLLHLLVTKYNYQIVRIQQHKDDIWIMNPKQERYPVIRISSKSNAGTLSDTDYIRNVHRVILNLMHREGPIMILNTSPESSPVKNAVMTQIRISDHEVSDTNILNIFPDLQKALHIVEDRTAEFVELSKKIEEAQLKNQQHLLKQQKIANRPRITYVIIAISVLVFLGMVALNHIISDPISAVIASGGYYKMNVIAAYEYHRLFTAGFLHGDILQLGVHLVAFYYIGRMCEHLFTKIQYTTIIVMSIIMGNLAMLIGNSNVLGLGLTSAILALSSAYITILIENRTIRHPMMKMSVLRLIWLDLIVVMLATVSPLAMLTALFTGCLFGITLISNKKWAELKKNAKMALICMIAGFVFLGTQVKVVEPLHEKEDENLIAVYHNTPLNWYATYLKQQFQKQYARQK